MQFSDSERFKELSEILPIVKRKQGPRLYTMYLMNISPPIFTYTYYLSLSYIELLDKDDV